VRCGGKAGHSSKGSAQPSASDGVWWSVVATWDDADSAEGGPPQAEDVDAWHVVLQPVSAHGDVVLAGGARPFDALATAGRVEGAAALITVAGRSPDDAREREFFRRFMHVSRDVGHAPGHVVSLVQASAHAPDEVPLLTFSVWQDLTAGLDWAAAGSPHSAAVARQQSRRLVETSGSVRCAVRSSSGTLGDRGDPLAGLRGSASQVDLTEPTP
jgi:heme-degrading monooxygenase HmoA